MRKRPLYLKNRGLVGPRAVLHAGPLSRLRKEIRLPGHAAHVLVCTDIITLFQLSRVHVGHLSDQQLLTLFCWTSTTKQCNSNTNCTNADPLLLWSLLIVTTKVFRVYVRTQVQFQKYSSTQFVTSTLQENEWLLHAPTAMLRQRSRVPIEKVAEQASELVWVHSIVFSPQAGFSRNQNPVRRPVWPQHTASWADSQGQVAIAFPRLYTFPPSPLGAFMSSDARDLQQRKVEHFVGEKCSDKFRLEFDFHVILEIFYMPQICDMEQTALLPLRRKVC